jgi:ribonuclease P protein component
MRSSGEVTSIVQDSPATPVMSKRATNPPERLRRREDFQRTLRRGRRARHPLMHLAARRTDLDTPRVGYAISKRVGTAVVRNKIRRRLRMIVRHIPWQPGVDAVFLVQPASASASYQDLESATHDLTRYLDLVANEDE